MKRLRLRRPSPALIVATVAPEGIHIIGASGEPGFQTGCTDIGPPFQSVGFKDKEGIVHLQGAFQCPATSTTAFQLPAGYQPAAGTVVVEAGSGGTESLFLSGGFTSGTTTFPAGAVVLSGSSTEIDTSGVSFRPGG